MFCWYQTKANTTLSFDLLVALVMRKWGQVGGLFKMDCICSGSSSGELMPTVRIHAELLTFYLICGEL